MALAALTGGCLNLSPAHAVTVPLGNLFDDAKSSTLNNAIVTDTIAAQASTSNLGVVAVNTGGLNVGVAIAPSVTFNCGPIAGGLGNIDFNFVTRAGVNDSATTNGSIRAVVIVSDEFGNILRAMINGVDVGTTSTAGVFSFTGGIPAELTALGNNYVDFDVLLGANARYLTLAFSAGTDTASDHGVWSGARLTYTQSTIPEPASLSLLSLAGLALVRRRNRA